MLLFQCSPAEPLGFLATHETVNRPWYKLLDQIEQKVIELFKFVN